MSDAPPPADNAGGFLIVILPGNNHDMADVEIPILESLYDSQGRNDALISLLVELCHLLGACLRRDNAVIEAPLNTDKEEGSEDDTIDVPLQIDPYAQLNKTLGKLDKRPGHDGTVLIRASRLSFREDDAGQPDYKVYFSDIVISRHTVAAMVRRVGDHMAYLNALILKAFQTLSNHKILTLFLRFPDGKPSTFEDLKTCLSIVARYQQALENADTLVFHEGNREISMNIMKDERSLPDPNLTLLAGLNAIQPEAMGNLVKEVHHWIRVSNSSTGSHRYASVYDAIVGVKDLRGKFSIPPIEMNNIRWFLLDDRAAEKLPKAKAQLAWLIREELARTPVDQSHYLESLYDSDYALIGARELGMRLKRLSAIIDAVGDRPKKAMIIEEVVSHLQWHMERIPDNIIRQVAVEKGVLVIHSDERSALEIGRVHDLIVRIIEFYAGRLDTQIKMRRVGADDVEFSDRDHEILARDFDISPLDVKEIIQLMQKCFDAKGRFNKPGFEACAASFARYEEKVFEIFWHLLKQPMPREDRVAFLNALQLLFVKMRKPEMALQVLLGDFLEETDCVHPYDRNGIMLSNLLLRRYNKELEIDIEITPEEVFLVREGLNREAAAAALMMIDQHNDAFFEKIRTIHRHVINSLDQAVREDVDIETKNLLALEREIHIFVSLLGGNIARSVLRSALNEYGNPDSEIYQMNSDATIFEAFLQHLKIIFRGLGRAGDASDEWIIEQAANRRDELIALSSENRHAVLVDRVLEWAEKAKERIQNRQLTDVT